MPLRTSPTHGTTLIRALLSACPSPPSTYACRPQRCRCELIVGRRSTTVLRSRGFFGVHAQSDVAACQQVVQGLQGVARDLLLVVEGQVPLDRKSTRLNSSRVRISYAVFCLKKKKNKQKVTFTHNITHQYT